MEEEKYIYLDFSRYFKEILRGWYWLVLMAILLTGLAYLRYGTQQGNYYSQATMYSAVYGSTKESIAQADYISSYTELIYTEKVCERARVLLGNTTLTTSDIQSMIKVSSDSDSVVISVTAYSEDPDTAVAVANAVAQSFVIEARSITGDTSLQMLDAATSARRSVNNSWKKYCLLAFAIGLVIPAGIIVLKAFFSDSVYHVEDAGLGNQIEVIGIIPYEKNM